ncbi:MAG: hypothetical protein ACLR3X_11495 [Intestinibacter bartlettii]
MSAKSSGSATITARVNNKNLKCRVTVKNKQLIIKKLHLKHITTS